MRKGRSDGVASLLLVLAALACGKVRKDGAPASRDGGADASSGLFPGEDASVVTDASLITDALPKQDVSPGTDGSVITDASRDASATTDALPDVDAWPRADTACVGWPGVGTGSGADAAAPTDAGVDASADAFADPPDDPLLPACDGAQGFATVELVADRQRLPKALIASGAGLAWLNDSEPYEECDIKGICTLSEGEVVSWPVGAECPIVVATGIEPGLLAGNEESLFFDFFRYRYRPLLDQIGRAPRDRTGAARVDGIRYLALRALESDGTDVFAVMDSPFVSEWRSVARVPAASFTDIESWTTVEIEGLEASYDTALGTDALYVAANGGVLAVDRETLEYDWFTSGVAESLSPHSIAVSETDVFYSYSVNEGGDLPKPVTYDTIVRHAKGGSPPQPLVTGERFTRDLEVDATHVYWRASADGCNQVRRVPRDGGTVETVLATSDVLTSLALHDSWIYVTVDEPDDGSVPEELPPPTGRVLRASKTF